MIGIPRMRTRDVPEARAAEHSGERKFRPDIEGLRAVAVMLAVLYHAKLFGVSGGYVGVDVFFVISGFLIARHLFENQQTHGRVQLADFYVRRMKRLLPAALVVTLAILVAARVWSSTLEAKDVTTDAIYSAFYAMNFRLAAEGSDYLQAAEAPSPLQHYWSLAVEEQFYFVLPLLVLSVVVVAARLQRRALFALIAVGCVVSLYFCVTMTASASAAAYFSTATRAWELGVGCLIALVAPRLTKLPATLAAVGSWAGLALIFYAGFVYTDSTSFPGTAALVPVAGAALVLATGCGPAARRGAEVLLGRWIAQAIGKISYSLYLWHWPVLLFAPMAVGGALDVSGRIQAVFVAFLLAVATYFHVEVPGRNLKLQRPAWVLTGPAIAGATAAVAVVVASTLPTLVGTGAAAKTAALTSSDVSVVQDALAKALTTTVAPADLNPGPEAAAKDFPHDNGCLQQYEEVELAKNCVFGNPQGTRTVALFGDSHATQWLGAFEQAATAADWKLLVRAKALCPLGKVAYNDDRLGRQYTECDQWREKAVADVLAAKPDVIVVSQADGAPRNQVTDAVWAQATAKTLQTLGADGARLVVLSDVPQPYRPVECVAENLSSLDACVTTPATGREKWPNRRVAVAEEAARVGAQVVDTSAWLCSAGRCPAVVGNMIVYQDSGGHVTNTYSTWLGPVVRPLLDGPAFRVAAALEEGLATTAVPANLAPALDKATTDVPKDGDCFLYYTLTEQGPCVFGDPAGTRTAVLFGDSHAQQWFGAFDAAAKKNGWRLIAWTKSGCSLADVPTFVPGTQKAFGECDTWRTATTARIAKLAPDLLIGGQSNATRSELDNATWAKATVETLRKAAGDKPVILLQDNPYAPADPVNCLSANLGNVAACTYERAKGHYYNPTRYAAVAEAVGQAGFRIVDTADWTCGETHCPVIVGNMLVYRDLGHLTDTFVTWLAPVVEPLLPREEAR
ncbi:MAG: acyltransferase family protein [Sporichthyaceae bacterium]